MLNPKSIVRRGKLHRITVILARGVKKLGPVDTILVNLPHHVVIVVHVVIVPVVEIEGGERLSRFPIWTKIKTFRNFVFLRAVVTDLSSPRGNSRLDSLVKKPLIASL